MTSVPCFSASVSPPPHGRPHWLSDVWRRRVVILQKVYDARWPEPAAVGNARQSARAGPWHVGELKAQGPVRVEVGDERPTLGIARGGVGVSVKAPPVPYVAGVYLVVRRPPPPHLVEGDGQRPIGNEV